MCVKMEQQFLQNMNGDRSMTSDVNIQYIDTGDGTLQYILHQTGPEQLIAIDQCTGTAVQIGCPSRQVLIDSTTGQRVLLFSPVEVPSSAAAPPTPQAPDTQDTVASVGQHYLVTSPSAFFTATAPQQSSVSQPTLVQSVAVNQIASSLSSSEQQQPPPPPSPQPPEQQHPHHQPQEQQQSVQLGISQINLAQNSLQPPQQQLQTVQRESVAPAIIGLTEDIKEQLQQKLQDLRQQKQSHVNSQQQNHIIQKVFESLGQQPQGQNQRNVVEQQNPQQEQQTFSNQQENCLTLQQQGGISQRWQESQKQSAQKEQVKSQGVQVQTNCIRPQRQQVQPNLRIVSAEHQLQESDTLLKQEKQQKEFEKKLQQNSLLENQRQFCSLYQQQTRQNSVSQENVLSVHTQHRHEVSILRRHGPGPGRGIKAVGAASNTSVENSLKMASHPNVPRQYKANLTRSRSKQAAPISSTIPVSQSQAQKPVLTTEEVQKQVIAALARHQPQLKQQPQKLESQSQQQQTQQQLTGPQQQQQTQQQQLTVLQQQQGQLKQTVVLQQKLQSQQPSAQQQQQPQSQQATTLQQQQLESSCTKQQPPKRGSPPKQQQKQQQPRTPPKRANTKQRQNQTKQTKVAIKQQNAQVQIQQQPRTEQQLLIQISNKEQRLFKFSVPSGQQLSIPQMLEQARLQGVNLPPQLQQLPLPQSQQPQDLLQNQQLLQNQLQQQQLSSSQQLPPLQQMPPLRQLSPPHLPQTQTVQVPKSQICQSQSPQLPQSQSPQLPQSQSPQLHQSQSAQLRQSQSPQLPLSQSHLTLSQPHLTLSQSQIMSSQPLVPLSQPTLSQSQVQLLQPQAQQRPVSQIQQLPVSQTQQLSLSQTQQAPVVQQQLPLSQQQMSVSQSQQLPLTQTQKISQNQSQQLQQVPQTELVSQQLLQTSKVSSSSQGQLQQSPLSQQHCQTIGHTESQQVQVHLKLASQSQDNVQEQPSSVGQQVRPVQQQLYTQPVRLQLQLPQHQILLQASNQSQAQLLLQKIMASKANTCDEIQVPTIVTTIPQSCFSDNDHSQDSMSDMSSTLSMCGTTAVMRNVNGEASVEISRSRREEPKYVEGKLALCHHCGYTSIDFNRCQRCLRKLPDNVKVVPSESETGKPSGPKEKKFHDKYTKWEASKTGAKKSPKRSVKKQTKLVDEPVCLTLSSDEEERGHYEGDALQKGMGSSDSRMVSGVVLNCDVSSSVSSKEPPPNFSDEEGELVSDVNKSVTGGGREMQSIVDGSMGGTYTTLICRTVRIGNYKVVPKDRILVSSVGVRIPVPSITDETKTVTVTVERSELRKVLIHFGRGMPVLFLYTNRTGTERIRHSLGMVSSDGIYYDPQSADDTQRRITLLPEKISEESKVALKSIFQRTMTELNNKEANELLVRASPREVQGLVKKGNSSTALTLRVKNEVQTILIYPPPPAKGGIPINTEDYACLGEDQFLNDIIIDFYLKFLTVSFLTPEDQVRTHVFSSFFYKRLTTRPTKVSKRPHPVEDDPKLSAAEKRHCRVKGWTKNVNLFDKDFIIIPINENCHWFLAIICFPALSGCVRMSDNSPVNEVPKTRRKSTTHKGLVEEAGKGMQIGSTTITPVKVTPTITLESPEEEGSDRDEAEGEDDDIVRSSSEEDEEASSQAVSLPKHPLFSDASLDSFVPKKSEARNNSKTREPIKQPCILIFDSLSGASRTRVVATLRDYLRIEYRAKTGCSREFNKDTIKGASPRVPQQTNFTDCGLYLLQYVESFFKKPIDDYHLPMKKLADWFPEEVVSRKREDIQKILLELMRENNVDIDSLNLPKLTFSSSNQNNVSHETQNSFECPEDGVQKTEGYPQAALLRQQQQLQQEQQPKQQQQQQQQLQQQQQQQLDPEQNIIVAVPLVDYPNSDGDSAQEENEQERTGLQSANFVEGNVPIPVVHKCKRIGTERQDPVDVSSVAKRMRPAR